MRIGGQTSTVRPSVGRWLVLGLLAALVLAVTPVRQATATVHRSPADCAARLDCGVLDIDLMTMAERLAFLRAVQRGPASLLVAEFDRWRNIEGVLEFFIADNIGEPGDWVSIVDASILEGVERGTAIALGLATDSFGNPGASLWASYLQRLRAGELAERAVHDAAWGQAEQAATDHGVALAAGWGVRPTAVERRFFLLSEAYRWTLRNEPSAVLVLAGPGVSVQIRNLREPFLNWLTNVRDDQPTRKGSALAYRMANLDPLGATVSALDLMLTYLPTLFREYVP
jgi:hypothetical protein